MSWSFNPPPGWPLPSGDWTPRPGWEPDPEWPPAPPGWEFWVHTPEPAGALPPADPPPTRARPQSAYPGRRRSQRRTRLWVGAAVAAAVLFACSGGTFAFSWDRSGPGAEPVPAGPLPAVPAGWEDCHARPNDCNAGTVLDGGALAWGVPAYVPHWNLLATTDTTLAQVLSGVLPTTGRFVPDGGWQWNTELLTGEPIRVDADPDTYQYRIRPDAVWSDGTDITADDFMFAWKHNAGDNDLCEDCGSTRPGYDRIDRVTGADGGKTVTVRFRPGEGYPEWFTLFSGLYPAHIAEGMGYNLDTPEGMRAASDWFRETPPSWSGGPWQLTEVSPGTSAVLVPNDEWYGARRPALDRIAFRFLPGPEAMWRALETGEIGGFGPLPDPSPADVVTKPGMLGRVDSGPVWDHLDFNLERKWTGDVALRRAIFTAIDTLEIVERAYPVLAPDTTPRRNHLFPTDSRYFADQLGRTDQGYGEVATALAILDDAGYDLRDGALTSGGEPVGPLVLAHFGGNTRRATIADVVADQLAAIGLEVQVETVSNFDVLNDGDYDLFLFGWSTGPVFSGDGMEFWHSQSTTNYGGYANDDVDSLVTAAASASDQGLAAQLLNEAMRYLVDDAYVLPIAATPEHTVVQDGLRNIRPNPYSGAGPFYNSHEWGVADGG